MREIKFRIWDELKKRMWQPEDIAALDFESKCAFIKKKYSSGYWIYFKNAKILQYTGLFDDTGKEIYEGDIVEVTEMRTPPHRAVVHFDFRGAWIDANPLRKELGFSHIQSLYDYCDYGFGRGILSTCKVIGNIYENPELLEVGE